MKNIKEFYEERQKYQEAIDALRTLESNDEDILEAIFVLEMLISEPEPSIEEIITEYSYNQGGKISKRKRYEYNDLTIPKKLELVEIIEMPNSKDQSLYRYGRGFKKGGRITKDSTWEEITDKLSNPPHKMQYDLVLDKDVIPYIQKQLGDKLKIIDKISPKQVDVTITIEQEIDLLAILHAGILYGINYHKI
jgi:hypothetical protein